ncbi:MAG: LPXTG cell wall anchor domain-containing protein [Oscillospiraceae bacterium]|nr:LPXTG cell wall anchor domain-containing protein [Oscillospiraceae bacterium]
MKIAKKVLAVVMALAMIAGLSAMAFAASDAQLVLKASEVNEDGQVVVTAIVKNAIGLESLGFTVTYDANVLTYSYDEEGADGAQVGGTKSNSFTYENNADVAGTLQAAFYFKTSLTDKATFDNDAKKKGSVDINATEFQAINFVFDVVEGANANTDISVKIDNASGIAAADIKAKGATVVLAEEKETDKTPVDPTPVTPSEESSTAANPGTGNEPTGDNMALAAAAGVALLAGAAFIVSKKRK